MAEEPGYVSLMKKIPKGVSRVLAIVSAIVLVGSVVAVFGGVQSANLPGILSTSLVATIVFTISYFIGPKPEDILRGYSGPHCQHMNLALSKLA
jgi:hypothetical protein